MTPRQMDLVRDSWAKMMPVADQVAAAFYARLFEIDPTLEPLFKTDLKSQGRKLMSVIGTLANNLRNLGTLAPLIEDLGRRHVGYGVKSSHYDSVAEALLWTLEKRLGDAFTPEMKEAWTRAYVILAEVMRSAARTEANAATVKMNGEAFAG